MFDLFSKQLVKQFGGAQMSTTSSSWSATLVIFLLSLIILFIKVLLVHWAYNEVVPSLSEGKMRKITISEALYLVILFNMLFT